MIFKGLIFCVIIIVLMIAFFYLLSQLGSFREEERKITGENDE